MIPEFAVIPTSRDTKMQDDVGELPGEKKVLGAWWSSRNGACTNRSYERHM